MHVLARGTTGRCFPSLNEHTSTIKSGMELSCFVERIAWITSTWMNTATINRAILWQWSTGNVKDTDFCIKQQICKSQVVTQAHRTRRVGVSCLETQVKLAVLIDL